MRANHGEDQADEEGRQQPVAAGQAPVVEVEVAGDAVQRDLQPAHEVQAEEDDGGSPEPVEVLEAAPQGRPGLARQRPGGREDKGKARTKAAVRANTTNLRPAGTAPPSRSLNESPVMRVKYTVSIGMMHGDRKERIPAAKAVANMLLTAPGP
ncbi:MAG: hypothetical protein ACYC9Q_11720 [Bacillota bacterium]